MAALDHPLTFMGWVILFQRNHPERTPTLHHGFLPQFYRCCNTHPAGLCHWTSIAQIPQSLECIPHHGVPEQPGPLQLNRMGTEIYRQRLGINPKRHNPPIFSNPGPLPDYG